MIHIVPILQNCVSVLALAVLYDVGYRLYKTYPRLRYEVMVGVVFSLIMMFMQLTPLLYYDIYRVHVAFVMLIYASLVGGWISGGITLSAYVGFGYFVVQNPFIPVFAVLVIGLTVLGYLLRVGYKPKLTDYKFTELMAVCLILICLIILLPMIFGGPNLLFDEPAIFGEWALTIFITFMMVSLVLQRSMRIHETEESQRQRKEYEGFLAQSMSDEIYHVEFDDAGNMLAVHSLFNYHGDGAYPMPKKEDNTINWIQMTHPDDGHIAQRLITNLHGGESGEVELRIKSDSTKEYVWRRMYSVPIMNKSTGRLERAYFALKDIEAEKRAQDEQHKVQFERQRVDILKAFSVQAEHQFRTPLTSIHTNLYLLRKVADEDKRLRYLDNIEAQAHLLLELVESLNLLTQIEIREELTIHNVQMNEIIQGLLPTFVAKAKLKNVEIKTILESNLPKIYANHQFIKSSVAHLLRNAVAYSTHGGQITVQTRIAHDEAGKKGVELTVEDTGVGMSEVVLAHAFERFFRADTAQTTAGLGLGLPLVKEVADHYGGSVKLHSKVGEGTTVVLHLPVLG